MPEAGSDQFNPATAQSQGSISTTSSSAPSQDVTISITRGSRTRSRPRNSSPRSPTWQLIIHRLFPNATSSTWVSNTVYNTFRYGLVMLYLGTLFMVIGYHNPWVTFVKYIGLAMAAIGLMCIVWSGFHSITKIVQRRRQRGIQIAASSPDSNTENKQGLPSYEAVLNDDLPTYEEAEELRLNPKYLSDHWMKRHSVPVNFILRYQYEADPQVDRIDMSRCPTPGPYLSLETVATTHPTPPSSARLASRRLSEIIHVETRPRSALRRQLSSRPSTSSARRFEDIPEVHLASPFNHHADEVSHEMSHSSTSCNLITISEGQGNNSRPRTTSAYVRSYSSSSFESERDDDSSSSSSSSSWGGSDAEDNVDVFHRPDTGIPRMGPTSLQSNH